jgi:orotate phosphoribosyltransferase
VTDRDDLLARITSDAVVHGKVTLSSGKEADYYVDLRRVTLASNAAPLVGRVMLDLTKDWGFDAVGGLTLGADPVATAMLHAAAAAGRKLDAFVVRKEGKAHGLQRRIEGPEVAGRSRRHGRRGCGHRGARCCRRGGRHRAGLPGGVHHG